MAHNFIQNGDLMADPDMEIRIVKKNNKDKQDIGRKGNMGS